MSDDEFAALTAKFQEEYGTGSVRFLGSAADGTPILFVDGAIVYAPLGQSSRPAVAADLDGANLA